MEHAQLEVSWLHPPEAQLVQDPAQYTTLGGLYTLHNTLHLVVSIHYTTQYTTLGGLYTLHNTLHLVVSIHAQYTIYT